MKKIITIVVLLVGIIGMLLPAAVSANSLFTTDLIAGGGDGIGTDVGEVQVWQDTDYLYVKYVVDVPGCYLTETHLAIEAELADIPQTKSGNPKVGKFEFSRDYELADEVIDDVYTIPWADLPGADTLVIAAHGVVNMTDTVGPVDLCAIELPPQVQVKVQVATGPYDPAYFPVVTVAGGTSLDGTYPGWCFDADTLISVETWYTANVSISYCTPPEALAAIIEKPENLAAVNYILNNYSVGQAAVCDGQPFTYGDIQFAIWWLLDDNWPAWNTGIGSNWTQCHFDEIRFDALSHNDFIPGCGDVVAVILTPLNDVGGGGIQILGIPLPLVCPSSDETVWAKGPEFPGDSWAMYFEYTVR